VVVNAEVACAPYFAMGESPRKRRGFFRIPVVNYNRKARWAVRPEQVGIAASLAAESMLLYLINRSGRKDWLLPLVPQEDAC
jgi:hypothetical protein